MHVYVAVSFYFNHQMPGFPTLITQETVSLFFYESNNFEQQTGTYEILYIDILKSQTYILRPQVPRERGRKLL